MQQKRTNFFEILIDPPIQSLYITESVMPGSKDNGAKNLVTRLSRDALISLYPLNDSQKIAPRIEYITWLLKSLVFNEVERSEKFFDVNYYESELSIIAEPLIRRDEYSLLRRFVTRVFQANDKFLLAIDPRTKLYNRLSLERLRGRFDYPADYFLSHTHCLVFVEKEGERRWARGKIKDFVGNDRVKVEVGLFRGTIDVPPSRVIPSLNKRDLASVVTQIYPSLDFEGQIKQLSEFTQSQKEAAIRDLFARYFKPLFPVRKLGTVFDIADTQLDAGAFPFFQLPPDEMQYLIERTDYPTVRNKRRLPGLSEVQITSPPIEHPVVLFGSKSGVAKLKDIVSQLNTGLTKGQFTFSLPIRFGIKLKVADEFINQTIGGSFDLETDRFLLSNEQKHTAALALVHLPLNSEQYYPIKAKLAHYGRVSQVISQQYFDIYAAWNLATNIYAKLGHVPWSVSESTTLPNADMVLGFAYSSLQHEGLVKKNIGYVNVFDRHGVWRFMQSSNSLLDFDKRLKLIPQLIRNAIIAFGADGSSPRIIDIHYSKRFSAVERKRTADVVRETVPEIQEINFISIDKSHPLRVFDSSTNSLNVRYGGILQLNQNEFLLSSSAEDKQDSPAGRLLKLRIWREPTDQNVDILPVAQRVLAMTKLNWRSAVRETSEPVTLKYAEEIANLTNHFGLTEWTTVNNQLSRIPWFI